MSVSKIQILKTQSQLPAFVTFQMMPNIIKILYLASISDIYIMNFYNKLLSVL